MTNEEAIKGLKYLFNEHELDLKICSIKQDSLVIRDMAIEALEKQIPKKPIWHRYALHCSCCDTQIMRGSHCYGCGQAVDWSEEKEEVCSSQN